MLTNKAIESELEKKVRIDGKTIRPHRDLLEQPRLSYPRHRHPEQQLSSYPCLHQKHSQKLTGEEEMNSEIPPDLFGGMKEETQGLQR